MPAKEIGLIAAYFLPPFFVVWIGTIGLCKLLAYLWPLENLVTQEEDWTQASEDLEANSTCSVPTGNQPPSPPHRLDGVDSNDPIKPASMVDVSKTNLEFETGGINPRTPTPQAISRSSSIHPEPTAQNHHLDIEPPAARTVSESSNREKAHTTAGPPLKKRFESIFSFCYNQQEKLTGLFSPPSTKSISLDVELALRLEHWFDPAVYFLLLIIGLPIFYAPGGEKRSLPLFTGVVTLTWLFSRRVVPGTWQKFLHPILVTSFLTEFIIWGLGDIKGLTLPETLHQYSTGANYLVLFRRGRGWDGRLPGAGDLMSSLLTGGIVALAFPLFRYRSDFYHNFFRLLVVALPNCALALLLWPWLAHKIGLAGERAITFSARFMSTPFGIQLLKATGGDDSLVVVLICITGILAVLLRDRVFNLCQTRTTIGSEDYFTIGCTIGVIAGAIGTSSLMTTHPRSAATATVMFIIYSMVLLGLVAVPAISHYVSNLAGL
ncbi:hypothetical protein O181_042998 [Austropuccinia psidii MF-1]|uniref:Uncharacterized protein n=1 Tax=Austropuccinia psidii MF-1 TaxID=1389203 RepID=A0A9Q3DKG2_9BASI|nr:hypothetical protein [Austropuccinia psidii MF-1]